MNQVVAATESAIAHTSTMKNPTQTMTDPRLPISSEMRAASGERSTSAVTPKSTSDTSSATSSSNGSPPPSSSGSVTAKSTRSVR